MPGAGPMQNRSIVIRLADIELFSSLESADLLALGQAIEERHLNAGATVCRRGEAGSALYAIAQGGVEVELVADAGGGALRVHLGPGQVFGEMALLSGQPVSATVVTIRDSTLYVLDKNRFVALLEASPRLLTPFVHLLIDRLRHRSQLGGRSNGRCVLVVPPGPASEALDFGRALIDAVARYAPGSIVVSAEDGEMPSATAPAWPVELGNAPSASAGFDASLELQAFRCWGSDPWFARLIQQWRAAGSVGRYLLMLVSPERAEKIEPLMALGDAVLHPLQQADASRAAAPQAGAGLADEGRYRIGSSREAQWRDHPWYFLVNREDIRIGTAATPPSLDRIARWLTHREVAIAMGAGAARGFAHLGVLQVLEEAGVPIDYVCGTSMGGAVALGYANFGNALAATEVVRSVAGSNRKVVDFAWWPGASMLRGQKVQRFIEQVIGDATFDRFQLRPRSSRPTWCTTSAMCSTAGRRPSRCCRRPRYRGCFRRCATRAASWSTAPL